MSPSSGPAEYSIAAVSKLTGVSCHALRVWERRYGFPMPHRSATGHRRYTHEQVEMLRQLANLARAGGSIGELIGDLQAGKLDLCEVVGVKDEDTRPSVRLVDCLFSGDLVAADLLIDQLSEHLTTGELIETVLEPAMIDIGERWFRGEGNVYQEHCASSTLNVQMGRLLDQARRDNADPERTVLVGTVQGDRHQGGVLMLSLALETIGWRAVPMGVDLPVEEYRKAIKAWSPDALGLSFVLSRNINKRFQELSQIREVPVIVGGRSIVNHQGLARRHGLIPLTGSLVTSATQLVKEVEAWERRHGRAGGPGG